MSRFKDCPDVDTTERTEPQSGFDRDGDAIMSTTEVDGNSSSDDEKLMAMIENAKMRNERLKSALRDKAASQQNNPSPKNLTPTISTSTSTLGGTSVFGPSVKIATKQADRQLAAIKRDRQRREAIEKENAAMRAEMEQAANRRDKATSQEEQVFANLARVEIRTEGETLRTFDKYLCAIALFLAPTAWPRAVRHLWDSDDLDLHPLHQSLLTAYRNDVSLNSSFVFLMKRWCERREPPPQYIGRMLFFRVVYDQTDNNTLHSRRHELDALLLYIRYACVKRDEEKENVAKLPPMQQVLRNFGAILSYKAVAFDAVEKAPKKCLDRRIMNVGDSIDTELERIVRNLGRAFQIWAQLVRANAEFSGILGVSREKMEGRSEKVMYCHDIGMLCIQVLLSPFGSRNGDSIGLLLGAVFNAIEADEWNGFRKQFARSVVQFTPRLGLLCDFVNFLLPFDSARARAVGLDIAYLTMWRWHSGPAECPRIQQIPEVWPVADQAEISFTLEDVVKCMEEIPELVQKTDVVWAQLMARMLKLVTLDHVVLETRQKNQLRRIQSATKRITKFAHRLPYGVASRSFQYSVDTLITALRDFVGSEGDGELTLGGR